MAEYAEGPGIIKEPDSGIILEKKPKLEDIVLEEKKADYDYLGEIKKMSEQAESGKAESGDLRVSDIPIDFGSLTKADEIEALKPEARHFQMAQSHILVKRWREALSELKKVLSINPAHHEAYYLTAYCHVKLNDLFIALEALLPLRGVLLDPRLESQVFSLQKQIRATIGTGLLLSFFIVKRSLLVDQLAKLVRIDPDHEHFHFMLAILYLELDRNSDAFDAVDSALKNKSLIRSAKLIGLKGEIERRLLGDILADAIEYYKEGAFGKAKKIMANVDDKYRSAREYQLFDKYLLTLSGGIFKKKVPTDVLLKVSPRDKQLLQQLIVKQELNESMKYIKKGMFDKAELELWTGKLYADSYPYLNFLLAGLKYKLVTVRFFSKQITDFDVASNEMESALELAIIGTQEKGIKEAEKLVKNIKEALTFFSRLKNEMEKYRQEVKLLNDAIMEFKSIMDEAKEGISEIEMLNSLTKRMQKLQKSTQPLGKRLKNQNNQKIFEDLSGGIRNNLEILESLQTETKIIQEANDEFMKLRKEVEKNISEESARKKTINRMEVLRSNIETDMKKIHSDQSRKALRTLIDAIKRDVSQLLAIKGAVVSKGDNELLEKRYGEFKAFMDFLNKSSPLKSLEDVKFWVEAWKNFLGILENDLGDLSSRSSKDTLKKLIDHVRQVKEQLERHL